MNHISNLIQSDQAFASEVLIIANSYLYAPRQPITNIAQALVTVGQRRLQGMCVAVGVRTFLGNRLNDPAVRYAWNHNFATAIIARNLALAGASVDPEGAYTAGILHDLGRMGLALLQPEEYSSLLRRHKGCPQSILPFEWDMCGFDHCQLGRKLAEQWNLPADFQLTAAEHHEDRLKVPKLTLLELIKISCKLADSCGYPSFAGCQADPCDLILAELPENEQRRFHPTAETLAAEINAEIAALGF